MAKAAPRPTSWQTRRARAITSWYLDNYYGTPSDIGTAHMYCDPAHVGHLAVSEEALRAGDDDALFKVLFTTTMFQRLADRLVKQILRRLSPSEAAELTSPAVLLELAEQSGCPHARSREVLLKQCDLTKHPDTKLGICSRQPGRACALKHHTVLLRRYGHFGKVPTSLALTLRELGVSGLSQLRAQVLARASDPADAAVRLEEALCRSWRISDKISAMFLSAVTNPDLSPGLTPWSEGIDWTRYVVVDSNVDWFLKKTGYPGPWTYRARREFVQELSRRIDLAEMRPGLQSYNPRIVQQALYFFMSESNRRELEQDCGQLGAAACRACPATLRKICPRRR